MRMLAPALLAALASCAVPPPTQSEGPITELAGRTPGAAQRCIPKVQGEPLRPGNSSTLLYGRGKTIWHNSLEEGCSGFSRSDVLISDPLGAQYCRGDFVRSRDNVSGLPGAGCRLGDFVPYTRN